MSEEDNAISWVVAAEARSPRCASLPELRQSGRKLASSARFLRQLTKAMYHYYPSQTLMTASHANWNWICVAKRCCYRWRPSVHTHWEVSTLAFAACSRHLKQKACKVMLIDTFIQMNKRTYIQEWAHMHLLTWRPHATGLQIDVMRSHRTIMMLCWCFTLCQTAHTTLCDSIWKRRNICWNMHTTANIFILRRSWWTESHFHEILESHNGLAF